MKRPIVATLMFLMIAGPALFVAGGCAGSGTMSPTEKLKRIAMRFNENIRWQRFEHASKNVPIDNREIWVAAQERAADSLRIVEYEMRPVLLSEKISILELDITYYRLNDQVISHQRRRQTWKNRDNGGWQLQSDKKHVRKKAAPVDSFPDLEAPEEKEES